MSFGENSSSEASAYTDAKKCFLACGTWYGKTLYEIPGKKQLDLQIRCKMQIHCCLYTKKHVSYLHILYLFCH